MLNYLGVKSYIIPHYNLPMPPAACGYNYRSDKIFTLEYDGTMTYKGYGDKKSTQDVHRMNVYIPDAFMTRAYIHLTEEVNRKLKHKEITSLMPNIRGLLIKFNGLEFLEG